MEDSSKMAFNYSKLLFSENKLVWIYIIIFTISWDDQTEWEQCGSYLEKEVVYIRRNASVGCFCNPKITYEKGKQQKRTIFHSVEA